MQASCAALLPEGTLIGVWNNKHDTYHVWLSTSSYTLVNMNKMPDPMPLFDDDPAQSHEDATDTMLPSDDDPTAVAASAASTPVGSIGEMDAWLSGAPESSTTGWMASDAQADAAMAAWLAADPNAAPTADGPVIINAGRVERARPRRQSLIPRWVPWVVLSVILLAAGAVGTAAFVASRATVLAPTVAGLEIQVARERLATVGLRLTVTDRRFSTQPLDTILSQTPEAGTQAKRGDVVQVVVSAGTEEFVMPDVLGVGFALARSQLEQRGLRVQVETQPSDQPSDTVLVTNPAAGAPVHTGDLIRLTIAQDISGGTTTTTSTLVPYTMTGVQITLDPASPVAGQPDTALEVARRLQSLLQASGATVRSTRSITDTTTAGSTTARQLRAREGSPTASVGFDIISAGVAGVAISYPSSTIATATAQPSQTLSSQISSALAGQAISARQASSSSDVVLSVTDAPYVRVTLGSTAAPEDLGHFRDTGWADKIARGIYQGIASVYGLRNSTP